ncbi:MAG TPA: DUF4190 domain-containing protein [Nocardioidaceae bacterium]|jgi:hypothetical protein|nr:DUF4190 domain-containing protein [Nocardioidaceae bacterium]
MSYTPPPPPPDAGGYGYATPQTNQKALWSMILGILSIVACGLLAGVPALILGSSAKKEIAAAQGAQTGEGMATAGVVLGWISVAISVVVLLFFVGGVASGGAL